MSSSEIPALRLAGVSKSFGDNLILDAVDLEVAQGERVALIGPSGSGKTTILRTAMALVRPDEGEVVVLGKSYWTPGKKANRKHLREVRTPVGMVFQAYNLFPHFTVLQNMLEAPVGVRKISRELAVRRAHELLDRVGLANKKDSYPRDLSGGQQQRVAIARALMLDPRLLLLDEVTSALDPELVTEVLHVISALADEDNVGMMIVTHEMKFAYDIAHRICMLDGGRIIEQGTPQAVFGNPTQARTRDFLSHLSSDLMAGLRQPPEQ